MVPHCLDLSRAQPQASRSVPHHTCTPHAVPGDPVTPTSLKNINTSARGPTSEADTDPPPSLCQPRQHTEPFPLSPLAKKPHEAPAGTSATYTSRPSRWGLDLIDHRSLKVSHHLASFWTRALGFVSLSICLHEPYLSKSPKGLKTSNLGPGKRMDKRHSLMSEYHFCTRYFTDSSKPLERWVSSLLLHKRKPT